jgi:hypothetical protein
VKKISILQALYGYRQIGIALGYGLDDRGFESRLRLEISLFTTATSPWCRIFFEKLIVTQIVKQQSAFFMEPKVSLPYLQKPATGHYPEPAESSSLHRSPSS